MKYKILIKRLFKFQKHSKSTETIYIYNFNLNIYYIILILYNFYLSHGSLELMKFRFSMKIQKRSKNSFVRNVSPCMTNLIRKREVLFWKIALKSTTESRDAWYNLKIDTERERRIFRLLLTWTRGVEFARTARTSSISPKPKVQKTKEEVHPLWRIEMFQHRRSTWRSPKRLEKQRRRSLASQSTPRWIQIGW